MDIRKSTLKDIFKSLSIDFNNLILNGSYNDSYFASDIDLYEKIDINKIEILNDILTNTKKNNDIQLLEIKLEYSDNKIKYNKYNKLNFTDSNLNKLIFVKFDFLLFKKAFPIELSIIYDVNIGKIEKNDIIELFLDDITKYKNDSPRIKDSRGRIRPNRDYNLYKCFKRMDGIAGLFGYNNLFDFVLNNGICNVLYLLYNRYQQLKKSKKYISKIQYNKLRDELKDELLKYDLTLNDDILKELNKIIKKLISK
jgi:hypothetical protein